MRFSVIIPVYNGAGFLPRCLGALRASTFSNFECLVVDDGSTDDSAAIATGMGMSVLRMDGRGGPARARNFGATHASGEILAFFDADVCVHPDTLARIDAHFRANPAIVAVMGSYDDRPADPGFVSQYKNLFHHFIHQQSRSNAWTFWAGCGAIRREVFLAAGGFRESYDRPCIEDIELGTRLAADGHRIDLEPTIQVTHLKRWTLSGLVRTDLFDRAVPWFSLILRSGRMPADLNVTHAHRVSVVLAGLLAVASLPLLLAMLRGPTMEVVAALSLALPLVAALVALNLDLYRFFAAKRGLGFAVSAVPLHWLYYLYSGVGVVLGAIEYLSQRAPMAALPALRPAPDGSHETALR